MRGVPAGDFPGDAREAVWLAFLRQERCALPLHARLAPAGVVLPPSHAAVLAHETRQDAQRLLSMQAQMRTAGRLLARLGLTGMALKGGAAAAYGGPEVDVWDLDLLLPGREAAGKFVALLEAECGYASTGADPHPASTGAHHMAGRTVQSQVNVEVHFTIPYLEGVPVWERVRPSRIAGIVCPAADVHLWHMMVHAVVQHPARRGQIRELVLLRDALFRCSAQERERVLGWMRGHADAEPLGAALRMAEALGPDGEEWADPFRGVAAVRLALAAGVAPGTTEESLASAVAMVQGRGEYARLWASDRKGPLSAAEFRGDTWLDRRCPRLAWLARAVVRAAQLTVGYLPARRLERAVRLLARDAPGHRGDP